MAQCKRCGTSFDYEKREGVCPKCCFYNRPPGTAWDDEEWTRHYNIEDNSYELPKTETWQEDDFDSSDSGRFQWKKNKKECHKEGSHSHKTTKQTKAKKKKSNSSSIMKKIIVIMVLLVVLMIAFMVIAGVVMSVRYETSTADTEEFVVENAEWEDLQNGVKAGQLTYQTATKNDEIEYTGVTEVEIPIQEKEGAE